MLSGFNRLHKKKVSEFLEAVFTQNVDEYISTMVLKRMLWSVTEHDEKGRDIKYLGQKYWSVEAIRHYKKNNVGRKNKDFSGLRHEHSIPRNIIEKEILNLKEKNSQSIFEILDRKAYSVIITADEDRKLQEKGLVKRMPEDCRDASDVFARYKATGIEIIDTNGLHIKQLDF